MADQVKRSRGRPKGASRWNADDNRALAKIADMVVREPMKPTTAMRRLKIYDEAQTHRLQRKWRNQGEALLEAARARHQNETVSLAEQLVELAAVFKGAVSAVQEGVERVRTWTSSPEGRKVAENVRAFYESPFGKALIRYAESEEARRLQARVTDPGFQSRIIDAQKLIGRPPTK